MAARSASHALNKRFIAGVCAVIALTVQSVMIDRSLSADDAWGAAGSPYYEQAVRIDNRHVTRILPLQITAPPEQNGPSPPH